MWIEIGEVTGSSDGGEINGVSYNHVFPVEIETSTGLRALQLGYNNGENPFIAAQRFIEQNGLDQFHLKQIADWIMDRSGQSSAPTFDLSSSGASSGAGAGFATSSIGSAVQISAPPSITDGFKFIPLRQPLTYDDVPSGLPGKIIPKIEELVQALSFNFSASALDRHMENIRGLVGIVAETSYYHSNEITAGQLESLVAIASSASASFETAAKLFPVFDLGSVTLLIPHYCRIDTLLTPY